MEIANLHYAGRASRIEFVDLTWQQRGAVEDDDIVAPKFMSCVYWPRSTREPVLVRVPPWVDILESLT